MNDVEIERKIRQAGYDLRWEDAAPVGGAAPSKTVYAIRDGKQHTRAFQTLRALAEHLGRVDRPVVFIEDTDAIRSAIDTHAELPGHFAARRESCRIAVFNGFKYVQLVSGAGYAPVIYELRADGFHKTSNSNLPVEIVTAFHRPSGLGQVSLFS